MSYNIIISINTQLTNSFHYIITLTLSLALYMRLRLLRVKRGVFYDRVPYNVLLPQRNNFYVGMKHILNLSVYLKIVCDLKIFLENFYKDFHCMQCIFSSYFNNLST